MYEFEGCSSRPVDQLAGLRQGCPLSSDIYDGWLDEVLTQLRTALDGMDLSLRIPGSGVRVSCWSFRDDVWLAAASPEALVESVRTLQDLLFPSATLINWEKCAWASSDESDPQLPLQTPSGAIPWSSVLRCLGTDIEIQRLGGCVHWQNAATRAWQAYRESAAVLSAKEISLNRRAELLRSLLLPILLWSAGVSPLGKDFLARSDRMQRRMLLLSHSWRRAQDMSLPDFCRHRWRQIRGAIRNLGPAGKWSRALKQANLSWLGHIARLPAEHPLPALIASVQHRMPGQPRHRQRAAYVERFRGTWCLRLLRPAEAAAEAAWRSSPETIAEYRLSAPTHWAQLARHRVLWSSIVRSEV